MRLGSRNRRQGDRPNRQMFLKHPGVEPVFLEKAARCERLKNFASPGLKPLFEKINVRLVAYSGLLHSLAQIVRSSERFRLIDIFH